MIYHDRLYGSAEITSPLIIELMQSAAFERLKGVLQHGITGLIGMTYPLTRFEHTVGAMLIVKRFGADEAEQVAALLHDVSHTAFSHVIDHAIGDAVSQSYHDEKKADYLATTSIPAILTKHGYDLNDVIDEEDFPLLEQPSPALCADRIDYFVRDGVDLGVISKAELSMMLDHLVVHEGRLMCNDLEAACLWGYRFMQADDASWSNFKEVGIYELTAAAIRRGLEVGAITEADFWTTDAEAWAKLTSHPDEELRRLVNLIKPSTQFFWDEDSADFRVKVKIRAIDPDIVIAGQAAKLSEIDSKFEAARRAYLERKQGTWPIRVGSRT